MRDTFIGVFGGIVIIVSVMCFALMRLSLGDVSQSGQARTAVNAAAAQLELETMQVERWLGVEASDEAANDAFDAASPEGRGDLATKYANRRNRLRSRAARASECREPVVQRHAALRGGSGRR